MASYNLEVLGQNFSIFRTMGFGTWNYYWTEGLNENSAAIVADTSGVAGVLYDFPDNPGYLCEVDGVKIYFRQKTTIAGAARIYYYSLDGGLTFTRLTSGSDPDFPALYDHAGHVNYCVEPDNRVYNTDIGFCFYVMDDTEGSHPTGFARLKNLYFNTTLGQNVTTYDLYQKNNVLFNPADFSVLNVYDKDKNEMSIYKDSAGYKLNYYWSQAVASTPYNDDLFGDLVRKGVLSDDDTIFYEWLDGIKQEDEDPFNPGGTSGDGGGTGDFDGESDTIEEPSLPTLSAVDTGFLTLFNPTLAEIKSLAQYMWSNSLFDLDTWKKIFDNPMDAIIGLHIVPCAVPEGGKSDVTIGNIITTVQMTKAATQYVRVDCGSINVNEYWGAYLDYAPYTKAELYLPYCGTHAISIDDIMGKTVHVTYHIDLLSGGCTAYVMVNNSVMYEFLGQCTMSVPVTSEDMTNVIRGVLSIASSIGSMVGSGGMSSPVGDMSNVANTVMSMKPQIEKSGSMSGAGGMMAVQTPYLILTRPRQCLPTSQNTFTGYPSYTTKALSNMKGFTQVEEVHLNGLNATDAEKAEIEALLKGGVIF